MEATNRTPTPAHRAALDLINLAETAFEICRELPDDEMFQAASGVLIRVHDFARLLIKSTSGDAPEPADVKTALQRLDAHRRLTH